MAVDLQKIRDTVYSENPGIADISNGYHVKRDIASSRCWVWREILCHIGRDARGGPVVDMGCGLGTFLLYLRDAGFSNLYGVDKNPEIIYTARSVFKKVGDTASLSIDDSVTPPKGACSLITAVDWLGHFENGTKMHSVGRWETSADCLTPHDYMKRLGAFLRPGGYLAFDWYITEQEQARSRQYIDVGGILKQTPDSLEKYLTMTRDFGGRKIGLYIFRRLK